MSAVTPTRPPDPPLQRYNAQLPLSYRDSLHKERTLLLRALHVLANAVISPSAAHPDDEADLKHGDLDGGDDDGDADPDDEYVSEGYQHHLERDLAFLEKGLTRYLDLKHALPLSDYTFFFNVLLRAALTPSLDIGLRSKLARCGSRLLSKRNAQLPQGLPWQRIMRQIVDVHIDTVDGVPFIGRDLREAHCRNFVSLLAKSKMFPAEHSSAHKVWQHFWPDMSANNPDLQFRAVLLMSYVLPTQGEQWADWIPDAVHLWQRFESSNDWDAIWMTLISRLARHQPCVHDFSQFLPWVYTRIEAACHLPLGAMAPQGSVDRRCPPHLSFLMDFATISTAARFAVYSLSPKYPAALHFLKRFFALIANYFHPSNTGRWSNNIGSFLSHITGSLVTRVIDERVATRAGRMDRVIGDINTKGVAPFEHRLDNDLIDALMSTLLPLIELGLHSKIHIMSVQAATSARDLAIIRPDVVVPPMLQKASEGLESISSPHRTTAALRLLATLTPVFLDPDVYPSGVDYLPQALQLTLPGIDPNDPGKTEATLRFVAGAAARIQGMLNSGRMLIPDDFLDDYVRQFLDRIFLLLDSLEAPAKKNPSGGYSGGQPLSYFIFSVAIENLFIALPASVAISAARKVVSQLTSAACMNAMKYYASLVRVAAATAASALKGSSVDVFLPTLVGQLLEEEHDSNGNVKYSLTSIGEDELVWRIRMLAQACRCVGSGIEPHLDQIGWVIRLAFDKPARTIYKSGGRLLRGVLEGLTAIQMKFDVAGGNENGRISEENLYDFDWRVPTDSEWKLAESFLVKFVEHAEQMCPITESSDGDAIASSRDLLFRVLRLLHAAQRGGRWLLAGALPDHFQVLEKYADEKVKLPKKDAKLILKRPISAGLGGERSGGAGSEFATKVWSRIYVLVFKMTKAVINSRPDDGALLYRCLEPLELGHEPFRRGGQSRHTMEASRSYKAGYRPIILSKRPFGSEGGVGRSMPRFIVKLRVEAHHEMRLTIAARGGIKAVELCEEIVDQLTDLALNDFPRVRGEARGVLTRALRVVKPEVRRREIGRIITVLRTSANKTDTSALKDSSGDVVMDDGSNASKQDEDAMQIDEPEKTSKEDVLYEKIIGASAVLRSSAAAPLIMRDIRLLTQVIHALLEAIPNAERPDGAGAVAGLFSRLSSLVRPMGIDPIRLVENDLETVSSRKLQSNEEMNKALRLKAYNDLNGHLLSMVEKEMKAEETVKNGASIPENETSGKGEAHWRVQSLVAILLFILIREDRAPNSKVAQLFIRGSVSDVVAIRQICSRAVALILALHGRKEGVAHPEGDSFDDSPISWATAGNEAMASIGDIACSAKFAKKLVHTLALDHDDDMDGRRGHNGGLFAMINYSRIADGESCWSGMGGRPWPTSWTPRSRDSLNLIRVRFYEALVRVFGMTMVDALMPCLTDMITKLENKEEKIISGVKDEDVRVLAGEVLAAICRGLDVCHCANGVIQGELFKCAKTLLNDMTGPLGNVNGATLIRLIGTAEKFTVGGGIMRKLLDWQLESKPLIVPLGNGPHAHLQARRLRYIHSCVSDIDDADDERLLVVSGASIKDLIGEVGFNHELKTVREEVGRLLSLLAVNVSQKDANSFGEAMMALTKRLVAAEDAVTDENLNGKGETNGVGEDGVETEGDARRKSRSRQGETLSRFVSIVYWNGRAREFEQYLPKMLPSLFHSFDESDPERISHSRMALSLAAQGLFTEETIDKLMTAVEETARDRRWKVRASVLGFLQIFSFCSLFIAKEKVMERIRNIVLDLLSDSQLEVRQAAAASFVTMIRDASAGIVEEVRTKCMTVLRETTVRRRGNKKVTIEGTKLFKRHGAVLGLSSMVTSSPYSVPEWMPSVLVALSGCVNDPPPISSGVRDLFGDFMRTHRDEWQLHKLAFTPDELEIVSELLVSPSYYA